MVYKIKKQNNKLCVYCSNPEVKARMIVKNSFAWAFPTNIPIVPGHILICPIRCVDNFNDLTRKEIEAIFDLQKRLKKSLQKVFNAEGFNYAWNEGEVGGQAIPHFHLHMLPKKKEMQESLNMTQENFFIGQEAEKNLQIRSWMQ